MKLQYLHCQLRFNFIIFMLMHQLNDATFFICCYGVSRQPHGSQPRSQALPSFPSLAVNRKLGGAWLSSYSCCISLLPQQPSTWSAVKDIVRREGFGPSGLYRGLSTTLARNGIWNAIYFGVYHNVKNVVLDPRVRPNCDNNFHL